MRRKNPSLKNLMMDEAALSNQQQYDMHAEAWRDAMRVNVVHRYLEKPAMAAELPHDMSRMSVLCIGVGSGEEIYEISKHSPADITGIDLSEKLLNICQARFPVAQFRKMDMNELDFPAERFDLVYASLVFHYSKDWDHLLGSIHKILRKGGRLVFSCHHPEYWGRESATGQSYTNKRSIKVTQHVAKMPADIEIVFYNHAATDAVIEAVEYAGFHIERALTPDFLEVPASHNLSEEERKDYKYFKDKNAETPLFLVIRAMKPVDWPDPVS